MHNKVKKQLAAGETSIGSWNMIGHTLAAEILGKAGFAWVAMDLEHGVINFQQLVVHCQVLEGLGVAPLCRLPAIRPEYFKWALDAGAQGVIVPWVRTVDDTRQAVAYARYAPEGERGVAITRVHDFGAKFDEYVSTANAEILIVMMIEHQDAVDDIEAILNVPGIDAIFIGPYDLSCSMGLMGQIHHPQMEAAIARVVHAARERGIAPGLHIVDPAPGELARRMAEGFRFIALGMDVTLLHSAARIIFNGGSLQPGEGETGR